MDSLFPYSQIRFVFFCRDILVNHVCHHRTILEIFGKSLFLFVDYFCDCFVLLRLRLGHLYGLGADDHGRGKQVFERRDCIFVGGKFFLLSRIDLVCSKCAKTGSERTERKKLSASFASFPFSAMENLISLNIQIDTRLASHLPLAETTNSLRIYLKFKARTDNRKSITEATF